MSSQSTRLLHIHRHRLGDPQSVHTSAEDAVIVEGPLQVRLNGKQLAVTMRTPGHDEALAHGLAVGEGFIEPSATVDIRQYPCQKLADSAVVDLTVNAADCLAPPRARNQVSSASCGLCGVQSIQDIAFPAAIESDNQPIPVQQVAQWFCAMEGAQSNFRATGGCHAAALMGQRGELLHCAEDVGRHNAVDKVIGMALAEQQLTSVVSLVVSGRVSFEIVAKAARAGIRCLAAVSAPSTLAVRTAEHCGICLLGFCRGKRFTVYSHAECLSQDPVANYV